jgi:hypothetical protein
MNEQQQAEHAVLERHEPHWIAKGYKVVRNPKAGDLPDFFRNYIPDALLLGQNPKVVVEIITKGNLIGQKRISNLKMLMEGHDDWRLEVLFAGKEPDELPPMPNDAVQHSLESIRKLLPAEPKSALLLCWATLEAIARRLEPAKTMRPQSPGRVVELLAGAGHVTPTEASQLRKAIQWRNRLIHGDLSVSLTPAEVGDMVKITEGLSKRLVAAN